jgi:hypothetical protein
MTCDPARPEATANVSYIFDLASSGGSDVVRNKDSMIVDVFQAAQRIRDKIR